MGGLREKNVRQHIAWALCIGAAASLLSLIAGFSRLADLWELRTYDLRMQVTQSARPKPRHVALFYVDEDSLRSLEAQGIRWPWPRELYAGALAFCRAGGARAVVFDLFYSEDSVYGVDDDAAFAAGVSEGPPSHFVLFLSDRDGPADPREAAVIAKSRIPLEKPYPPWTPKQRSLQSLPIEPLVEAAAGFGNAQIPPDADGIYRRIPLVEQLGDVAIPSIALKVATETSGERSLSWPRRSRFALGATPVPLDESGQMLLNYYGGVDTFPVFPLAKVLIANTQLAVGLTPQIDPAVVRDKIVIIGVAAPGLYDLKPTPLAHVSPGPEVHATAIENLLAQDFITPTGQATAIAITVLCSIAAAGGLVWISSIWGMGLWILAILTAIVASAFGLFWHGISMPLVAPTGAAALSSFGMVMRRYLTEGRKKREIRRAFGQYLSPHVVGEIARDPDALALGGTMQEITIFFSDIADFTTCSEQTPAPALVGRLNEYFSTATRIIQAHDGTLDKYIGDAIMAFWGAPLPAADHAVRAVRSALEIQQGISGPEAFVTRIGIHTGMAVVGNIGSDVRFNYTAIGDTVNLASRLEGLNKQFGTRIIISESTWKAVRHAIEARRIGQVRVKGRSEAVGIFEPLGTTGQFGSIGKEGCREFGEALELFEAGKFDEARTLFERVGRERHDRVALAYEAFCNQQEGRGMVDADGAISFTAK